ncbi:unnamed protein product [Ostreobium quekettii]|uniref:Uncharacterized protein n=1 Tax=Ostreobium quekettii TaxID=121088 RepID=A0A8S1JBU9_9CHLO|nr:unnamed protein product [Ostreobium quekettii]|eukprot:evm.model.scf_921.2 EVM.evm.TU.scf_921.2   scf_921:16852-20550(+)
MSEERPPSQTGALLPNDQGAPHPRQEPLPPATPGPNADQPHYPTPGYCGPTDYTPTSQHGNPIPSHPAHRHPGDPVDAEQYVPYGTPPAGDAPPTPSTVPQTPYASYGAPDGMKPTGQPQEGFVPWASPQQSAVPPPVPVQPPTPERPSQQRLAPTYTDYQGGYVGYAGGQEQQPHGPHGQAGGAGGAAQAPPGYLQPQGRTWWQEGPVPPTPQYGRTPSFAWQGRPSSASTAALEGEIEALRKRLRDLDTEQFEKEMEAQKKLRDVMRQECAKIAELTSDHEAKLKRKVDEFNQREEELKDEVSRLKQELRAKDSELSNDLNHLRQEMKAKDAKLVVYKKTVEDLKKQVLETQEQLEGLKERQRKGNNGAGPSSLPAPAPYQNYPPPNPAPVPAPVPPPRAGYPQPYAPQGGYGGHPAGYGAPQGSYNDLQPPAAAGAIACPMACGFAGTPDDVQVHMIERHPEVMGVDGFDNGPATNGRWANAGPTPNHGTPAAATPSQPPQASSSGPQLQVTFVLPNNTRHQSQLARNAPMSELKRVVSEVTGRPQANTMMLAGGRPLSEIPDMDPWVNALSEALKKEDVVSIICIPKRK